MSEFNAGDRVYCPHFSTNVLTLVQSEKGNHFLAFEQSHRRIAITTGGKMWEAQGMVADIVHATPENHELLEKLYGVEFEKPPLLPTSREIIEAMLARGHKDIPCWVSDTVEEPSSNDTAREIHYIEDGEVTYYVDTDGNAWFFATPFNPHTNEAITELPE